MIEHDSHISIGSNMLIPPDPRSGTTVYGDPEVSLFYLFAGLELILVFVVLTFATRCLSDRLLVSAGGSNKQRRFKNKVCQNL